ncbi:MAG: hypothetical protein JKY98_07840 [Gammaproteobacteria bacterium]|nr:hypothetical protein [Gammaproteobacteria bacterium]
MPRMQVTFNNASRSPQRLKIDNQLTTLMFRIDFCGKSYDCVGHIERNSRCNRGEKPVHFSGYCGYNGRIDIQKLSSVAEDYYWSIIKRMKPGRNLSIDKESSSTSRAAEALTESSNKSYEFNVGEVLKPVS